MRYLITYPIDYKKPYMSSVFVPEEDFNEFEGMIVYDLAMDSYTSDGKIWHNLYREIDQY